MREAEREEREATKRYNDIQGKSAEDHEDNAFDLELVNNDEMKKIVKR